MTPPLILECNMCHESKVWGEFYQKKTGALKSRVCRKCCTAVSKKAHDLHKDDPSYMEKKRAIWRKSSNKRYASDPDLREQRRLVEATRGKDRYSNDLQYRLAIYAKVIRRRTEVKKRAGLAKDFTDFVTMEARQLAAAREQNTGVQWDVDHTIPLQGKLVSGLHTAANISVITRRANRGLQHKPKRVEAFGVIVIAAECQDLPPSPNM